MRWLGSFWKGRVALTALGVVWVLGCASSPTPPKPPMVVTIKDPVQARGRIASIDPSTVVLMVGGRHDSGQDERLLADLLPELAGRGFGVLALELPRSYQPLIDAYLAGEDQQSTARLLRMIFDEDFPRLLDVAVGLDLRVLCYESMETFDPWAPLAIRDRRSYETIRREILAKDPEGKVVLFCGALHLRDGVWYSYVLEREERCLAHYLAQQFGPALARVDLSKISGR